MWRQLEVSLAELTELGMGGRRERCTSFRPAASRKASTEREKYEKLRVSYRNGLRSDLPQVKRRCGRKQRQDRMKAHLGFGYVWSRDAGIHITFTHQNKYPS